MASGRDANGQFAKGNQIAKGNSGGRPKKQREDRYYEIMMNVCTFADWKAIGEKAVEQAKGGDKDARKWLADYLIGSPPKKLDVTSGGESIVWLGWGDGDEDSPAEAA